MRGKAKHIVMVGGAVLVAGYVAAIFDAVTARPLPTQAPAIAAARQEWAGPASDRSASARTVSAHWGQGEPLDKILGRAGLAKADRTQILALDAIAALKGSADTTLSLVFAPRKIMAAPPQLISLDVEINDRPVVTVGKIDGAFSTIFSDHTLVLPPTRAADSSRLVRYQGLVGDNLTQTLRRAGVAERDAQASAAILAKYLASLPATATYDLVVDQHAAPQQNGLAYVGLFTAYGEQLKLVKLDQRGIDGWFKVGAAAAVPTEAQGVSGWHSPVTGARVSSNFGWRLHPIFQIFKIHTGIDYAAPRGTPVHAAQAGVVSFAADKGGYGRLVEISHDGALASRYAHLDGFAVASGQRVARGEVVGYVGSSGRSTGPHLHFELLQNGHKIDPASARIKLADGTRNITAEIQHRYNQLIALAPVRSHRAAP